MFPPRLFARRLFPGRMFPPVVGGTPVLPGDFAVDGVGHYAALVSGRASAEWALLASGSAEAVLDCRGESIPAFDVDASAIDRFDVVVLTRTTDASASYVPGVDGRASVVDLEADGAAAHVVDAKGVDDGR